MSVLDSKIEALAFDYLGQGILAVVNKLWALLAVVTAALSSWSLQLGTEAAALTSGKSDSAGDESSPAAADSNDGPSTLDQAGKITPESGTAPVAVPVHDGGETKGKFTSRYYGDWDGATVELADDEGVEEEVMAVDGVVEGGVREWWECCGRVLRMATGEEGWYQYQDLTVISGSVVRLWDGHR